MNAERKNERVIFKAAIKIASSTERAAYLEKVCGSDGELLARVEALLKAHDKADSFLEAPAVDPNATLDDPPLIDGPGTKIGRYELLEQIGEGGMGLVYMAQQKKPVKRKVALKIIKPGMDSKQVIARFEAERQALAVLDHPNIAHVFDAGTTKTGRPYFIMEYVKGMSITRYCDENKLDIEKRLRLFEQVCEGIHHAHQKGIIHRDLKPSNILVSVHGDRAVPKIIDFGIAKAVTQPLTEKTVVTFQGQLLGTPEYMSPEQVDMATQDIDTRSDIYSLGVVLYELLAGVLPFEPEAFASLGFAEVQRTIREQEPASPSTRLTGLGEKAKTIAASRDTHVVALARRLHRELEWVPLKAMRKDRCRRYRSASELADDVRHYLDGLPLIAGPETATYRMQKFVHKHAGSVATVALVAVAIVVGLIVSTAMYIRSERALEREAVARVQAEDARVQAEDAKDKETTARTRAEKAEEVAQEQRKLAEESAENYRRGLYVNTIQLADAKYREGDTQRIKSLLASCPNDLRGWEWNHLNYIADQARMVLRGASNGVVQPVFSPDGKLIASGGWGKSIKIWDATSGSELMDLTGHEDRVCCVAFSPDGQRLACGSADKTIKLWDVQSGRELRTFRGESEMVYVAFSPDGKRIASAEYSGMIRIWNSATGKEITNIQRRAAGTMGLGFSPDGSRIASGNKTSVCVWDTTSGAEVMTIASAHKLWVTCVAYSPDGKSIVSCGWDSSIKVWDASTGKRTMVLRSRSQRLDYVSYDAIGKHIVAQDQGNSISVWNTVTGEVVMTVAGHEASIRSVSFSPDGRRILSGSQDRTIRVWDTSWSREPMLIHTDSYTLGLSYSPDGKRFATGGLKGGVTIWDAAAGTELTTIPAEGSWIWELAFSPDGRRLASGSDDGTETIWDATTGSQLANFSEHKESGEAVNCMAFSPDGSKLVVGGDRGMICLYDSRTGKKIIKLPGHEDAVGMLAYYPDGSRILSGCWDGTAKVWDAATGTEVLTIRAEQDTLCGEIAISHDGRLIATGTNQGSIILWDAETGKEVKTWAAHTGRAQQVSFSPDDRRLASVSRADSTVKVWDIPTGTELMTLVPQQDVYEVAFSPDGRTITVLSVNGIILWETTEPTGGYELRETGQMARRLTAELYVKHGLYYDVIDKLKADKTLDESVRKVALQIANSRTCEDAEMLTEEGWEIVSSADKDIDAYKSVLEKAKKVASLEPDTLPILTTLGVGQYRVGAYTDALGTLKRAEKMRTDGNLKSDPNSVAFLAMTQYQLGQVDEGRSAVNTLRDSLEKIMFVDITSGNLSYWIEAEKVFAGTNKQLLAIWELIETEELDRAAEMFTELQPPSEEVDSEFNFSLEGMAKYLSRECYARGKSRLVGGDPDYVNRASDYEAAVRVDPNYVSALKDLAWLRATCTVEEVRNVTRAVEAATLACGLTGWKNHECLSVLAGAYSESGRFAEAVNWQQEAIGLLSTGDQANWGGNYSERMRLYQSSMPYSAGGRWSFTKGKIVAVWDFSDIKDGVVGNHLAGGPEGRLVDGAEIVTDTERGNVLGLHGKGRMEFRQDAAFDISGAISLGPRGIKARSLMGRWPTIISKGYDWNMYAGSDSNSVTLSIVAVKREEYLQGLTSRPIVSIWARGDVDLADERWHHVAGTYDGKKLCLYIDGNLSDSKRVRGNIATNDSIVVIGDNPEWPGDGAKWDGLIDDVRIYSYAWSAEEVKDLYEVREPPREKKPEAEKTEQPVRNDE